MKPHKHAELIKAWADGAEIQVFDKILDKWVDAEVLIWRENYEYRIKPREFEDKAWYPVVFGGRHHVVRYDNYCKAFSIGESWIALKPDYPHLTWIGEKLDINWPEEAE